VITPLAVEAPLPTMTKISHFVLNRDLNTKTDRYQMKLLNNSFV